MNVINDFIGCFDTKVIFINDLFLYRLIKDSAVQTTMAFQDPSGHDGDRAIMSSHQISECVSFCVSVDFFLPFIFPHIHIYINTESSSH